MSDSKAHAPADVYRREARRLRGRYATQPGKLYNSLRHLSDAHDRNYPGPPPAKAISSGIPHRSRRTAGHVMGGSAGLLDADGALLHAVPFPSDRFAQLVAIELEAGILRYSARSRLLSVAQSLGMGRFQANLVIAAMQYQRDPADVRDATTPAPRWLGAAVSAILLQILLATAFWCAFLSH